MSRSTCREFPRGHRRRSPSRSRRVTGAKTKNYVDTYHLVDVGGRWAWILEAQDLAAYELGGCPAVTQRERPGGEAGPFGSCKVGAVWRAWRSSLEAAALRAPAPSVDHSVGAKGPVGLPSKGGT